jgi:hypothetical protein
MIIDGMDQNHTRIPQVRETTFGEQITQHLTGVLIHGTGMILILIYNYIYNFQIIIYRS